MSEEKQQQEIELLKAEIDILKKELTDNKKNDDKRHQDIKQIQKEHHQDNLKWNKISAIGGSLGTPLALILPFIINWINKPAQPKQERSIVGNQKDIERKLDKLIKLLEVSNNYPKEQEQK